MQRGKSQGDNGVILEFYQVYWYLIGEDFRSMILHSIRTWKMPTGMTRGLIALLFKARNRHQLGNWRPITLFNLSYKIFAKAPQLRLQSVLMEIMINQPSYPCILS
jgi:hypothetical protein